MFLHDYPHYYCLVFILHDYQHYYTPEMFIHDYQYYYNTECLIHDYQYYYSPDFFCVIINIVILQKCSYKIINIITIQIFDI